MLCLCTSANKFPEMVRQRMLAAAARFYLSIITIQHVVKQLRSLSFGSCAKSGSKLTNHQYATVAPPLSILLCLSLTTLCMSMMISVYSIRLVFIFSNLCIFNSHFVIYILFIYGT
jgi:hypothetical protein